MSKYKGASSEPLVAGDVVLGEVMEEFEYCRVAGTVTVAAGTTLEAGQVLEPGVATADYDPLAIAANANAVLLERLVNNTAGNLDMEGAILNDGPAIVNQESLSDQGATELAALAALGIKARTEGEKHTS